jgi:microbial collagenase
MKLNSRHQLAALIAVSVASSSSYAVGVKNGRDLAIPASHTPIKLASKHVKRQAPAPHLRRKLPPTIQEQKFNLPPTHHKRTDLMVATTNSGSIHAASPMVVTPSCQDMNLLSTYSGSALADYIASLPDYECTYGLFSITSAQAATIYSPGNLSALASRFAQEAASYDSTNMKLVNLELYFRAGYYLASSGTTPAFPAATMSALRPTVQNMVGGATLFAPNAAAPTTAGEMMTLITNMHDESNYLPQMKSVINRFTNTSANPNAALALTDPNAAAGYTGALNVFFNANSNPNAVPLLQNDPSYATALYNFVTANKSALLNTGNSYQLNQTANEAFRFMQYPALFATVKPMVQNTLATSTMTGTDNDLWIAAAQAVEFYDNANCGSYGTCNFETTLANAILSKTYPCPDTTVHLRTEELTPDQASQACTLLATEKPYFMAMVQSSGTPVPDDFDTSLEVVVFSNNAEYDKYSPVFFGNDTDNGGIYLEGEPQTPGNQSRFIAFEADWLRPVFSVWNLGHEYVHYMDGRFDMYGDFALENQVPVVWWLEGLAEYISLKNVDQTAIDAANTGQYKLSTIYQNTYAMDDYLNRAYYWGYMSVRFMFERHPEVINTILPKFRVGDYTSYNAYMTQLGTSLDAEFAAWVPTVTTGGTPPIPGGASNLPACQGAYSYYLGKNCSIGNLSASGQAYVYINLPTGAKNLKLWTSGGTGDEDLYVSANAYPTTSSYGYSSVTTGNNESISIPSPVSGQWYYVLLNARQAFSNVTINASYE